MSTRNSDAFANERTFLAYLRTALSFVAFGFVVARFSLFAREFAIVTRQHVAGTGLSKVFGVAMAFAGIAAALYGTRRFVVAKAAIDADKPASMPSSAAIVFGVFLAVVGAIVAAALLAVK